MCYKLPIFGMSDQTVYRSGLPLLKEKDTKGQPGWRTPSGVALDSDLKRVTLFEQHKLSGSLKKFSQRYLITYGKPA